jgi:hypothetical protein
MSSFTTPLKVEPLDDGKRWMLCEEFCYDVGSEGSADRITVPAGFKTDFASVPRPFWSLFPPWGTYGKASVLHDWLYWEQRRPRGACDAIFLEAMGVLGVSAAVRYSLYSAVRTWGWLSWRKHRGQKGSI